MIDEQLILSAREIKKKYIKALDSLSIYEKDIKNIVEFLKEKAKNLEIIQDVELKKKAGKEELARITKLIVEELTQIEDEEKRLLKRIESINSEIQNLQKEEQLLYSTIKKRYPKLTDDEIIKEIQRNLKNIS
jgi:heme oxygenase